MNRFYYESNEITITGFQCELCVHLQNLNCMGCDKFKCRPKEVLENQIRCPEFKRKGQYQL